MTIVGRQVPVTKTVTYLVVVVSCAVFVWMVIEIARGHHQNDGAWLIITVAVGLTSLVSAVITPAAYPLLEEAVSSKVIEYQIETNQLSSAADVFRASRQRLSREVVRLQRNSILNLALGCLFSLTAIISAVSILTFTMLAINNSSESFDVSKTILDLIGRVAVVIFVQILGFYFLRLYENNEKDIKHTKNEMTNLEMWFAGTLAGGPRDTKTVAQLLLKTERNFVLKKGERSAAADHEIDLGQIAGAIRGAGGSGSGPKGR